ncbi:glycosyltransferase [Mycolicibacterium cosmeticum]|uniref:glycosyltransferase n=1 Tax=Mycolicibacterium cosmeticum TaxID=258533 RepID=UPI003204AAB5
MRVCFFIASLDGGGAQRQCIALLNALQHMRDVEAHLILLGPGTFDDRLDTSRLTVHRTQVRNFGSPAALAFAVRSLRRVRPDVVISWLHPADIWSFAATRIVRVPWIMTERGSVYPGTAVFKVRNRIGRHAPTTIIANSRKGQRYWEDLAPRCSVLMIPNMVIDGTVGGAPLTNRSHSNDCLFVGRLEPEKNVGAMITAFARFAAVNEQAKLLICGKGSLSEDVAQAVHRLPDSERVDLLGFRHDVPALMSRARIFLSLSRYEGMPNVVMEAAASGLPAVVSDIPEHRALLGDDYPFYVRLDATPEISAAVLADAWMHAESAGPDIYSHARDVLATMTPERVVADYLSVFSEVIGQVSQGRKAPPVLTQAARAR